MQQDAPVGTPAGDGCSKVSYGHRLVYKTTQCQHVGAQDDGNMVHAATVGPVYWCLTWVAVCSTA